MPYNLWRWHEFLGWGDEIYNAKVKVMNLRSMQKMSGERSFPRTVQRTHPERESMMTVMSLGMLDIRRR